MKTADSRVHKKLNMIKKSILHGHLHLNHHH